MTPAQQDKARRLVELPGWRWVAGMRDQYGNTHLGDGWLASGTMQCRYRATFHADPDILDPATAGLLVQMVPGLHQFLVTRAGTMMLWSEAGESEATTLGEAAADALLAAGRCA